jgi:hypothetical protein
LLAIVVVVVVAGVVPGNVRGTAARRPTELTHSLLIVQLQEACTEYFTVFRVQGFGFRV